MINEMIDIRTSTELKYNNNHNPMEYPTLEAKVSMKDENAKCYNFLIKYICSAENWHSICEHNLSL